MQGGKSRLTGGRSRLKGGNSYCYNCIIQFLGKCLGEDQE